jgi:hypothetical protein
VCGKNEKKLATSGLKASHNKKEAKKVRNEHRPPLQPVADAHSISRQGEP